MKIFALSFALGVVSSVTMSFEFGANWPGFMEHVGNIASPLLAYEVLVAGGITLSAFWILVFSSWMQTPVGSEMGNGVAHALDWQAVIFNPSMPYGVTHMLLASGLTVSFLVAGLSAYRWLRGDDAEEVRLSLGFAVRLASALIPLQILAGDLHGLNTLKRQPDPDA